MSIKFRVTQGTLHAKQIEVELDPKPANRIAREEVRSNRPLRRSKTPKKTLRESVFRGKSADVLRTP